MENPDFLVDAIRNLLLSIPQVTARIPADRIFAYHHNHPDHTNFNHELHDASVPCLFVQWVGIVPTPDGSSSSNSIFSHLVSIWIKPDVRLGDVLTAIFNHPTSSGLRIMDTDPTSMCDPIEVQNVQMVGLDMGGAELECLEIQCLVPDKLDDGASMDVTDPGDGMDEGD